MLSRLFLAGALALALPLTASARQAAPQAHETTPEVPALSAMHEVIMPLWHEAWPAKDTKKMAEIVPEIDKHVGAVAAAKLPGILREKQTAWDAGVKQLQATAAAYRGAVQRKDNDALLKAAEALHMDYEKLVRVIRPITPEIDAFHQALYVIYHYDLEKFSLPAVREHVQTLKAKMDALDKAELSSRHAAKKAAYESARTRLSQSVAALVTTLDAGDEQKIKAGIEEVHSSYEALDGVFTQ